MTDSLPSKKFLNLASSALESALAPHGFKGTVTDHCVYYRQVSPEVFHFVSVDRLLKVPKYDVRVFAHSPLLSPDWEIRFPGKLGAPSGSFSFLHSVTGVGPDQQTYFCRTQEGFLRDFEDRVAPALGKFALPYLDEITTLDDLARTIREPIYMEAIARLRTAPNNSFKPNPLRGPA